MEPRPHLDQRRRPPIDRDLPRRGRRDACQQLQYRALAGTIVANDPESLPALDLEAHLSHRPEFRRRAPQTGLVVTGFHTAPTLAVGLKRFTSSARACEQAPRDRRRRAYR